MKRDMYAGRQADGRVYQSQSQLRQFTPAPALSEPLRGIDFASFQIPRHMLIGTILIVALLAFEIFNFDTTQYALRNLLGDVRIIGLGWASILAIAFCAIDFAGLVRMFTPERGGEQPKEVWYLMGAWLLGATMNALMTWWAVSLTLLNHEFGNEVLSREQLLSIVPVFVAVLVWLTRILFIGALTMTGEQFFRGSERPAAGPRTPTSRPIPQSRAAVIERPQASTSDEVPDFLKQRPASSPVESAAMAGEPARSGPRRGGGARQPQEQSRPQPTPPEGQAQPQPDRANQPRQHSRVRRRPPVPRTNGVGRQVPLVGGLQADSRGRRDRG